MTKYKIKHKIVNCENTDSVTTHDLYPHPYSCHKLSQTVTLSQTPLSPFIAALFNASMSGGYFPASQKIASITPILKKASLDPLDLGNYRPISNLTFLSKLLERAAYEQIVGYMECHHLLPPLQSAYQKHRSTETATIKVMSDIYRAADAGLVMLLGLLDLSAAFDTVDHVISFWTGSNTATVSRDSCSGGSSHTWLDDLNSFVSTVKLRVLRWSLPGSLRDRCLARSSSSRILQKSLASWSSTVSTCTPLPMTYRSTGTPRSTKLLS